jgi:hypothetical protein
MEKATAIIERMKAELDALGGIIGHNDHTATIFDQLELLAETVAN